MADLKILCMDEQCMNVPKAGTEYSAGANIQIEDNVISATDTKYTAGANVQISNNNEISATDTKYTAGANLQLSGNEFSVKASPSFTGTPTAPTNGTASTSNTQIATTAFVQNAINRRLPKALTVNISNTTSVSVANNTVGQLDIWTATATGLFIGEAEVIFAQNATGYRFMDVGIETTAQTGQRVQASTGGNTQLTTPFVARITSGKKVRLRYSQLSGGALNVTTRELRGILIPD